ncbi:hypothetical protein [Sphingomonas cavernae]|nr:hypothetical protein [Sphingomonas cavernae]
MKRRTVALALALLPCPVIAQPVAASFQPPLDREIRYEVVETRQRQGLALVFTLDQRVRFTRDAGGYRMKVIMQSATAKAPAPIAQRFDAAFRPFVGLEIALLLSTDGKPLGLLDEAGTWSRLLAAIEALKADSTLDPAVARDIERVLAGIAALPAEARAAKLMESPLRLVGYALPPVAPGGAIESGDARQSASAMLRAVDTGALTYAIRTRKQIADSAFLTSEGELRVDRATGLLLDSSMREWVGAVDRAASAEPDARIDVKLAR